MEWISFLTGKGIRPRDLATVAMPERLFGSFLAKPDRLGVVEQVKKEVPPAAQALFYLVRDGVHLADHSYVKTMRRNTNAVIRRPPRNDTIWPFAVFTQYAR